MAAIRKGGGIRPSPIAPRSIPPNRPSRIPEPSLPETSEEPPIADSPAQTAPPAADAPAGKHASAEEAPPTADASAGKAPHSEDPPSSKDPHSGSSGADRGAATSDLWPVDLHAELSRARRETEELRLHLIRETQQRDELLQVVSHELRTPITVIDGFNRLLLSEAHGPLSEPQRHALEQSRRSCQRLHLFVANLLEKDRLRGGESPPCPEPHRLGELFDGVAAFLAPLVSESGQRLEMRVDAEAQWARFDPSQIEQVLVNLVGNALKYGPRGGTLRLEAQPLGQAEGDAQIEVSVSDEGVGVPHDDRERIFEAYVRREEHAGAGGLGLGLAICRRIVEAHGGSIGVGEAATGGSRFAFTLSACPPRGTS